MRGPCPGQATTSPFVYRRCDGTFVFEVATARGIVRGGGFSRQRDAVNALVEALVGRLAREWAAPRARC
ncbi:MAG TPA: hypothetical protein VFA94_15885 [Acidimicrobiales bacterium]|nr:hypothetical protein [Acidimicrobiales bacterium]